MIIEGLLVNSDGQGWGKVEINPGTGLVERVGNFAGSSDLTLSKEELVFPGFGDVHVHAREDESGTQTYKEDFLTMSHAALHGGVTFVADMPNNPTAPVTAERYERKKALAARSLVPVTLYGGVGPDTRPLSYPVPYKVFMGKSVGDLFFETLADLEATLARYAGENVSFHPEDPEILKAHKNAPTHPARRPSEAEVSAIDFALGLIRKYKLQGKLCHISTLTGARRAIRAKSEGLPVTLEITPHHLYFEASKPLQMNPPLRREEDRLGLLAELKSGNLDYLATDHAPHSEEERAQGISGVPHLDTYGPFVTWLIKEQGFAPERIADVCSLRPGIFVKPYLPPEFGLGFGRIESGYAGSLTVLNLSKPYRVDEEKLETKCGWSPFEGVVFPGRVSFTVERGRIYPDGRVS